MDSERWKQVDNLLQSALEHPPEERDVFLRQACAGDEVLEREVRSLLAAQQEARSFLESPAIEVAAKALGRQQGDDAQVTGDDDFGRYHILRPLGEGGMGTVYLAEQREPIRRCVALKLVKAGMSSREVMARFESERQALALMDPQRSPKSSTQAPRFKARPIS